MNSKRRQVRIYDKKLWAKSMGKTSLYVDYFADNRCVSRLEIELRNQACKVYEFDEIKLTDPEYLYKLFATELDTRHLFFKVPSYNCDWSRRSFKRGTPDPVLRFREACIIAKRKGVDIKNEVIHFYAKINIDTKTKIE
jgi:hypothetical protein